MPDTTARLGLPLLAPSQAQKHVTHNEALLRLDGVTQLVLTEVGTEVPPLLPELGATYALGPVPGGSWAGQAGNLALWQSGQWQFITPKDGWLAWDKTAGLVRMFQSGVWAEQLQNLAGLGIGTTSDTQNLLAVAAPASLLSHAGAGHQLKINKAAAGDTASLLFQSGWFGRAEMGLTGDNNFHLKTSADGATWTEALVVNAASGSLSGSAIQSSATDDTAGRVMTVGAFGLGGSVNYTDAQNMNTIPPGLFGNSAINSVPANSPKPTGRWAGVYASAGNHSGLQIAHDGDDAAGLYARRKGYNAVWGGWTKLYSQASLLGGVSQTAGSPTGAVIERGSNANGDYVRFADGTQICVSASLTSTACTIALGSGFRSNSNVWTFPVAFATGTVACVSGHTGGLERSVIAQTPGTTSVSWRLLAFTSFTGAETARLLALGRWF